MSEPMPALSSGQSLGERFTLVRRLGDEGAAELWLVRDAELGEDVVAKILPPDASEESVSSLQRECREARRQVLPGAARVLAAIPDDRVAAHLSGLKSPDDVAAVARSRADAALIGEALMRLDDPRALLGSMVAAAGG